MEGVSVGPSAIKQRRQRAVAKEPTKLVGGMVGAAGGYTDGQTVTTGDERRSWGVQTLLALVRGY